MNLKSLAEEKYGFTNCSCELLLSGVNDTYLINSDQGKFIFRGYRSSHRTLFQIQQEVDLLLQLKAQDVSVSFPIVDLSDVVIHQVNGIQGINYVVMFSYAPGSSVKVLSTGQLQSLGKEMAKFHNVGAQLPNNGSRWNFDFETTIYRPLELLRPFFSDNINDYSWLQESAIQSENIISRFDTSAFSKGYCHFDFLPKNFHFENDLITLFDFDFVGTGWLVNDIMSFRQHLILDVYTERMTLEDSQTSYELFLDSYQKLRPLSDDELQSIPYLGLGFWLFYMGFHTTHDQFHRFLEPEHLKSVVRFLRYMCNEYAN